MNFEALVYPAIGCLTIILLGLAISFRYRKGPLNWRVIFLVPILVFIALLPVMICGFLYQTVIEGFRMGRDSYHGIMDFLVGAER